MHEPLTRAWNAGWRRLLQTGLIAYAEAIEAHPARFRERVEGFVDALRRTRGSLDRMRGVSDPRIAPLETRYAVLVTGLLADHGAPSDAERIEGAPLLVVAGIGVGIVAITWAVVAYQYAVHLREHTALLEKELVARVEASREGRTLQPSTVEPAGTSRALGWVLLGGLALGAAGLAWRGRTA